MHRILIAEDEARIASFLEKGLQANGFVTTTVGDGVAAYRYAASGDFDLLVLDIGLPVKDGFAVLQDLRAAGVPIPVVILTARDSSRDTIAGLEAGADDYVRKPFVFEELLARIRLRLRAERSTESSRIVIGDLALDLRSRQAVVEGRTVELTSREFALAAVFMRHPDVVLSREQLLREVWGFDFDPGSNVVDVYVRYLRRKLGDHRIETIRGQGYRLRSR